MADAATRNVELATSIATAWIGNPHSRASADDVASLVASVHSALGKLTAPAPVEPKPVDAPPIKPAVSAKESLKIVGRIISMIDGKPYASLNRHLKAHGLTPDEYRRRFKLPASYPMIAPGYSDARRALSKGMWSDRKASEEAAKAPVEPKRAAKGRKSVAEAKAAAKRHLGGKDT